MKSVRVADSRVRVDLSLVERFLGFSFMAIRSNALFAHVHLGFEPPTLRLTEALR